MPTLHKTPKLLKWQFILILAICRRTLLWRDEIWSSNNCGKARVTADLCFCVFVASLYQPKQNNRTLFLLSTDTTNLGAWSFHYKLAPTSAVTYIYLPRTCHEQGIGSLWSCYEHLFSSLPLTQGVEKPEGLQWFRLCQLPWAAVEHSQFISSSTIKRDSFYSKMPRFYDSLLRICLNRWVWKLFFPIYKSMLNHAILPCWYCLRFAQSYSPLPILQTFQEREHLSEPAKQKKKKKSGRGL